MVYILFILSIALSCIVLLQFGYLAFLNANNQQLKNQLDELTRNPKMPVPINQSSIEITSNEPPEENWPEFIEAGKQKK